MQLDQLATDISIFILSDAAPYILCSKVLNDCGYPGIESYKGKNVSFAECGPCRRVEVENQEGIICRERVDFRLFIGALWD